MATRIYTDATDFDAQQGHFTIEVVDNQYYLRIGALNSEDQRLIGSLIDDGFVGFFQDDVRIAIAGIASTYDAENDRIEIDREPPELQIEDAYVIRFTQARPGEDGEGGIGTPGDDGEHAEIEIEDTDTGIRVRGKSGGEPDFGPWQDVRDGEDGQDGTDGNDGEDGWSPEFSLEADGDTREVLKVVDWHGGEGRKPAINKYVGQTGFVDAIADGVNIRGSDGDDGEDGDVSNLNFTTRGELIATSSYIPQNTPNSNLNNDITWTLNPNSDYTDTDPNHVWGDQRDYYLFERHTSEGRLAVPYNKVANNVNGMWAVCEDMSHSGTDDNDPDSRIETWEIFIPWGPPVHNIASSSSFESRYILHFRRSPGQASQYGDDMTLYYWKRRNHDYKPEIILLSYGRRLPSNRCRVKIYLAGIFLSVSSE